MKSETRTPQNKTTNIAKPIPKEAKSLPKETKPTIKEVKPTPKETKPAVQEKVVDDEEISDFDSEDDINEFDEQIAKFKDIIKENKEMSDPEIDEVIKPNLITEKEKKIDKKQPDPVKTNKAETNVNKSTAIQEFKIGDVKADDDQFSEDANKSDKFNKSIEGNLKLLTK